MRLPKLQYGADLRTQQTLQFGGVQYGRGGGEGDFAETKNLSSRQYPSLCQRADRELVAQYTAATALYAKGALAVVDGTSFLYDGETVGTVTAGEKEIVSVNTKILIFPDKKYYDTATFTFGSMADSVSSSNVTWTTNSLKLNGSTDLDERFAIGQAVKISGSSTANNLTLTIRGVSADTLTFTDNSFTEGTETGTVTVAREIPDFDCVCESANRLWGAAGNTIYASALGDPLTFFNYDGLSTDAYAVSVGTDGDFTACESYSSNVLFFKEHMLHKMLGSMPSEYRMYDYTIPGVQAGSQKSLVTINETLYYKGVDGIYAYAGSTPSLITQNFGVRHFQNAVAGTDGSRYYVSMQDMETNEWSLYCYDTLYSIWLREDDTHAVDFARLDTHMHFLSDSKVWKVTDADDEAVDWTGEFYPLDDSIYGKRGYSKLWMKLELAEDSWVMAEISEDGSPWHQVGMWHYEKSETMLIPIFPAQCDTFRLRLSGHGRCVIKNMVREFDVGSEKWTS